jgi:hypothetical protein
MTLTVHVRSVGVSGPGLLDWPRARPLLCEPACWASVPTVLVAPKQLPPAERRRAGQMVRICLAVADEAVVAAGIDTSTLATVFTSSSGDPDNCHALCEALAQPQPTVSPTRFTNSVHNAPAGYWHIANASRAPSSSLCAYDASFGAGLLEAAVQCVALARPVLLVAADVPYPHPLHGARPLPDAFGVALLLDCEPHTGALARLDLQMAEAAATPCDDGAMDALRAAIPAARCLPLLQALARGQGTSLYIETVPGVMLQVECRP